MLQPLRLLRNLTLVNFDLVDVDPSDQCNCCLPQVTDFTLVTGEAILERFRNICQKEGVVVVEDDFDFDKSNVKLDNSFEYAVNVSKLVESVFSQQLPNLTSLTMIGLVYEAATVKKTLTEQLALIKKEKFCSVQLLFANNEDVSIVQRLKPKQNFLFCTVM